MLNDLKFVGGAVAKKDYVPELTHLHIDNGFMYAFNGVLAICTPTDLAVTATPKAASFIKAVEKLPENKEVVLNLTAAGRLSVKAGNFRVYIECHSGSGGVVKVEPEGERVALPGGLLPILNRLAPFMGIDASRPWAMGIRFDGEFLRTTNNVVLVEHWIEGIAFPWPFTVPAEAIKAIIRTRKEPVAIQVGARSVSFHFDNGSWIRTQLGEGDWPDVAPLLDREDDAQPVPEGFFEGVARLDAFSNESNSLFLSGGKLSTSTTEGDGAMVELDDFGGVGHHHLRQMLALQDIAKTIDFGHWPAPCLFYGDMLRGVINGMRM